MIIKDKNQKHNLNSHYNKKNSYLCRHTETKLKKEFQNESQEN